MTHDENKLPLWAQERLAELRRGIVEARRENRRLRGEFDEEYDSNDGLILNVDRFGSALHEPPVLRIPVWRYRVSIQTPHGYRVGLGDRRGLVEARVLEDAGQGCHGLRVIPQASNVVLLDAARLL